MMTDSPKVAKMIRKATIQDVKAIHKLLQYYGDKGTLLARPLSQLYDHVRDFFVYQDLGDNRVVGCCALQFCWEDLAEIRSLAVHPDCGGRGIGRALTKAVVAEAVNFKTRKLFTLTYEPGFFLKFGFRKIDRAELPLKIWSDCITCVKFPDCDETAMMMDLE
jgi:amino-acid N-acetyltransferase